jgi:hypothetical protein
MRNISGAVGRKGQMHCKNSIEDQIAIVNLLNRIPERFGGTGGNLQLNFRDGICPDELHKAILRFQATNIIAMKPDDTIEPGDISMHLLNRLADRSFPIQRVEDYVIESFVEDLYEETLAEAIRDFAQAHTVDLRRMHAKSF